MIIQQRQVWEAAEGMKDVLNAVPLQYSATFSRYTGHRVWVKPENLQKTGSFKIRGAYNKIRNLDPEARSRGVITGSSGNHGAAVAFAASRFEVPAVIVMPEDAPMAKQIAVKSYGGHVVLHGRYPDERKAHARELAEEQGLVYVDSTDDEVVMAGQGTTALEILRELPEVDVILAPIGGGGLISGIAALVKQMKPSVEVVGVEPRGGRSMHASLAAGRPTAVEVDTIADGLRSRQPGDLPFSYCERYLDRIHLVEEDEIVDAMIFGLERLKLLLEPSGAVSLAGVLGGAVPGSQRRVVAVLSGGNVERSLVQEVLARGERVFGGDEMRP